MHALALPLAPSAPATLEGAAATIPTPLADRNRREAAWARWTARLWMGGVLLGVLLIILVAFLVAPIRALFSE